MKFALLPLILSFVLSLPALAQSDPVRLRLHTDLDSYNWRFRAGDDTAWASPTLIDTAWTLTKLNESNRRNEALWQAGRGWFRLALKPSPKVVGKDTYLAVSQFGESKLYFDGKQIATLRPARIDSGGTQRLIMVVPLRFTEPLVSVAAQDVGRVLVNLFSNAFYAVQQRAATTTEPGYQPTVTAKTRRVGHCVEMVVEDNGTGIPEDVRSKIFQPFFTTKPTGQGTGLGLSLSYDIITKGHGGTLTVDSKADQFTRFTIQLPTGPSGS